MTKLVSTNGVIIDAMPEAVERLLAGGTFALCAGEVMPQPVPVPEPESEPEPAPAHAFDRGAFGGDAEELLAMTAAELRAMAEALGAKVPSKASKARIIEIIEAARG